MNFVCLKDFFFVDKVFIFFLGEVIEYEEIWFIRNINEILFRYVY